MKSNEQLDQLVGLLYQAAFSTNSWVATLRLLADYVTPGERSEADANGLAQTAAIAAADGCGPRGVGRADVAEFSVSPEEYAHVDAEHFNSRFVQPSELGRDLLLESRIQSLLELAPYWSKGRDQADKAFLPDCEVQQTEAPDLQRLGRHLSRALHLHRAAMRLRLEVEVAGHALNLLRTGVVFAMQDGEVIFANERAIQLLHKGLGLTARRGKLVAERHEDHKRLEELLRRAVSAGRPGAQILSGVEAAAMQLIVLPLSPGKSMADVAQQPLAMVLINAPAEVELPDEGLLRQLFEFTPAETRLALGLLSGMTLDEHAENCGVSLATVRTQLRSLFAKTQTRRQAELVRLLGMVPPVRKHETTADGKAAEKAEKSGSLARPQA